MVGHHHFGHADRHCEPDHADHRRYRGEEPERGGHRREVGRDIERVGRREQHHSADEDPSREAFTDQRAQPFASDETQARGCLLDADGQR